MKLQLRLPIRNAVSRNVLVLALALSAGLLSSCKKDDVATVDPPVIKPPTTQPLGTIPTDLPVMFVPGDNPVTTDRVELGRHLFYDENMAVPSKSPNDGLVGVSCGSCHDAGRGFSDKDAFSTGFQHKTGTRNAPGLTNVAYNTFFTWDGKFKTLEAHVPAPMFSPVEMGNNFANNPRDTAPSGYGWEHGGNDTTLLFDRIIQAHKAEYTSMLVNAYGDAKFSLDRIVKAIASFERTFISTESPFDAFNKGDKTAISASAQRGFDLFRDSAKGNCISCHSGYNFTDGQFHNNGLVPTDQDQGLFKVSKKPEDRFKFKVPTLRNVALSAPYMHDGRFTKLEQVIAHYNSGGSSATVHDKNVRKLNLSDQDIQDIAAFLNTLTDSKFASNSNFSNPWK